LKSSIRISGLKFTCRIIYDRRDIYKYISKIIIKRKWHEKESLSFQLIDAKIS